MGLFLAIAGIIDANEADVIGALSDYAESKTVFFVLRKD